MHPFYFWLFPWLIAAESMRIASAALSAPKSTAEIIPFPARRIRRRVASLAS